MDDNIDEFEEDQVLPDDFEDDEVEEQQDEDLLDEE